MTGGDQELREDRNAPIGALRTDSTYGLLSARYRALVGHIAPVIGLPRLVLERASGPFVSHAGRPVRPLALSRMPTETFLLVGYEKRWTEPHLNDGTLGLRQLLSSTFRVPQPQLNLRSPIPQETKGPALLAEQRPHR